MDTALPTVGEVVEYYSTPQFSIAFAWGIFIPSSYDDENYDNCNMRVHNILFLLIFGILQILSKRVVTSKLGDGYHKPGDRIAVEKDLYLMANVDVVIHGVCCLYV